MKYLLLLLLISCYYKEPDDYTHRHNSWNHYEYQWNKIKGKTIQYITVDTIERGVFIMFTDSSNIILRSSRSLFVLEPNPLWVNSSIHITHMCVDDRGLISVQFIRDNQRWARDYMTPVEFLNFIE